MTYRIELNGDRVTRARIEWPSRGLWTATLSLPEPRKFVAGEPLMLKLGDVDLVGSAVRGGDYADAAEVVLRAGRSGWCRSVKPRSYRSNSVRLSNVVRDLASEVGETLREGFGPSFVDHAVGYAMVRRGGQLGREVLAQLVGERWHVDELGQTVIGDRPAGVSGVRVLEHDAARARAEFSVDDGVMPRPGQTVTIADGAWVLERVIVSVDDDSSVVGVLR